MLDLYHVIEDSLKERATIVEESSTKLKKINWSHPIGTTQEAGVKISVPNNSKASRSSLIQEILQRISSLAIRIHLIR